MERVFLFCLIWALGGLLDMKERPLLDHELRSFAANMPPREDESDTIFEWLVSDTDLSWGHWKHQVGVGERARRRVRRVGKRNKSGEEEKEWGRVR
jgi:dynein heavy chain